MVTAIVLIIEIMALIFLKALGINERPAEMILVMIAAGSVAYIFDINRDENLQVVELPLVLGLFLRLAFLLVDIFGKGIITLPNSGADTEMFYRMAVSYSEGVTNIRGGGFFVITLGTLFKLIGVTRLYAQFLLIICSLVALLNCDLIMREYAVSFRGRLTTMTMLCLMPNFAILSSILLRESIVVMLSSISLLFFSRWIKNDSEGEFIIGMLFAMFSMRFHSGMIGLLLAYLLVRVVYNKKKDTISITVGNVISTFLILIGVIYFLNTNRILYLGKFLNIDTLEDLAVVGETGGSSYSQFVGNSNSLRNIAVYTLPRMVFFMFSPFPFQWRGAADIIAFVFSSLLYLIIIIRVIRSIKFSSDNKNYLILFSIIAFTTMLVFAWGTVNSGTAIRHRDKMVVLFGVLLGLTFERNAENTGINKRYSQYLK